MSDPLLSQVPTAWQLYIPMLTSLARDCLTAAGTFGWTWALGVTGSQVEMGVSVILICISVVWGKVQKYRAQQALNVAASRPAGAQPTSLPA